MKPVLAPGDDQYAKRKRKRLQNGIPVEDGFVGTNFVLGVIKLNIELPEEFQKLKQNSFSF